MMNRPLVLTSESSGHPFRRSLPPHVLRAMPSFEPEVIAAQERAETKLALRSPDVDPRALTRADAKDFVLAFVAGFLAFSLWLA